MDDAQPIELTDDQVTGFIADPATIPDHDHAIQVLDCLDAEIASIQAQIDQAVAESMIRPLTEDRQAWLKRASYAAAMRRNERHKVFMRDKEIRGTKFQQRQKSPDETEVKRLKQVRLMEEAQTRREIAASKRAQHNVRMEEIRTQQMEIAQRKRELAAQNDFRYAFHLKAQAMLPPEMYQEIVDGPVPPEPKGGG